VLEQQDENPDLTAEEVLKLENVMGLPLGEALSSGISPDLVETIMNQIVDIGVPQSHLRLVSKPAEKESSEQKNVGGVQVEITDIESPVQVYSDSTFSRGVTLVFAAAMAFAAAYLVSIYIETDPTNSHNGSNGQMSLAANELNIIRIESDETVQIFTPTDNKEPTIIFIEDFEGAE
jgi:hypothetical protein